MTHGELAAEYVASLYGRLFDLDDVNFQQLQYACRWHTQGGISSDPTIGACWDADRLDLTRVGIVPNPDLMSTEPGKEMAATRSDLWSERELEALLEDARKEILLNSNGWNRMDKLLDYCPMLRTIWLGEEDNSLRTMARAPRRELDFMRRDFSLSQDSEDLCWSKWADPRNDE